MSRDFAGEDKRGGATDPLKDVLARRRTEPVAPAPAPAAAPAPAPVATPVPAEPRASSPRRKVKGTTRSWYLHQDLADELSATCETLYFDLRGTKEKAEILGVLIRVGLNNLSKVRKQLGLPPAEQNEPGKQPASAGR